MYTVIEKQTIAPSVKRIKIQAADIARKAAAGQFVMIMVEEKGERIPLTITDKDASAGTIDIIFQEVGYTTERLGEVSPGENLTAVLGPLGKPTEVKRYGTVVCVGGGIGTAEMLPVAGAMKQGNNEVIAIIGARTKSLILFEKEIRKICSELYVTTDDGSYGRKGVVVDVLRDLLTLPEGGKKIHLVYAVGPVAMMAGVAEVTRPCGIKTIVSLNPIMVDATGMCGSCRCMVAGEMKFACVDGPEFDGHQVDFDELNRRLQLFKEQEEQKKLLSRRI